MLVDILTNLLSVDFGLLSSVSDASKSTCFGLPRVKARACAQLNCGPELSPDMYTVWAVTRYCFFLVPFPVSGLRRSASLWFHPLEQTAMGTTKVLPKIQDIKDFFFFFFFVYGCGEKK